MGYITLGRGRLEFGKFATGTTNPRGERYFGNTTEFGFNSTTQKLDHFGSDAGVREKDESVTLQSDRVGKFTTDIISPENLAMFFLGSAATLSVTGATITDEAHADVEQGLSYQLGVSSMNPTGVRGLIEHSTGVDVVVKVGATTKTEVTDYTVDMALGRIYIVVGGGIADADDITVSYKTSTSTRSLVISGNDSAEGSLRYIADNPAGDNVDYFFPWVKITPNGDFNVKSGDTWQTLPFNIEILKKTGLEAQYATGRASS